MDIYVESIPFKWNQARLREIFEEFGEVESTKIVINKMTRQNKGFGFVMMPNDDEARNAIKALDGTEIDGRTIIVNISTPKSNENRNDQLSEKKNLIRKNGSRSEEMTEVIDFNASTDSNIAKTFRGFGFQCLIQ